MRVAYGTCIDWTGLVASSDLSHRRDSQLSYTPVEYNTREIPVGGTSACAKAFFTCETLHLQMLGSAKACKNFLVVTLLQARHFHYVCCKCGVRQIAGWRQELGATSFATIV